MKKLFFFLLIISAFLFKTEVSLALSSTPTPTDANSIEQKLKDFSERIASRTAELKLIDRRGIIGTITDISDTHVSLLDLHDNIRLVDVDELTKFSSPSAKGTFGISDITKGTTVGVLGLYNKDSRRLLARFVDVLPLLRNVHGAVLAIDNKNFNLTVVGDDNQEYSVDVETTTKTSSFLSGATKLAKSGFSQIVTGEHIVVIGTEDPHDQTHITAARIVLFSDIPKNPKITVQIPESNAVGSPTSTP